MIFDQHVHSNFSFDSNEDLEKIFLELTDNEKI